MAESLADRLDRRIRATGPIPVAAYVEAALYDPDEGFYATHGRAGRRGDFLTAPEVGPLFGAVVARAVDRWWDDLGRPAPFTVLECGAGPGTLARAVLAAEPEVLVAGALRWCLVERSAAQREAHPAHPAVCSAATIEEALGPAATCTGVVVANELLDNLPFGIAVWRGDRWTELAVGERDATGRFTLHPTDTTVTLPSGVVGRTEGDTAPSQPAARQWLSAALGHLEAGRVVVFDYGGPTAELLARDGGWLRTHRAHEGDADWRRAPGSCDITTDVAFDQLQVDHPATTDRTQAAWLQAHGIDDLVEEGRRIWEATAGVGDLAALRARSRIREAEALCDAAGMGAFRVLEWPVPQTAPG